MATQPSDSSKHTPQRTLADELAVIAQRAQAFTNASGAAIALSEGVADEIVCKARSGSSSPEVGAVLRVDGTFTGACIQTGRELRCDDTETDTRVDTVAVRALGIRSMVITPVKDDSRTVGVLAVFASTAHAFTITHVAVLKTMADQISGLILKERRAREEGLHPEPPPNITRTPSTPPPGPVAVRPVPAPGPVVVKPVPAPAPIPVALPVRPIPAPVTPITAKAEPVRPVELAADVAAPATFPVREQPMPELKTEPVLRTSFGTFDAMGQERAGGGKGFMVLGFLALVLIAGSAYWYLRVRKAAPVQPASSVQNAPAQAADPNAQASGNSATPAAPASTSTASNQTPETVLTVPQSSASKSTRSPALTVNSKPSPVTIVEVGGKSLLVEKPAPEAPAPVAISNGPSKIVAPQQPPAPSEPAPSLSVGSATPSSAISSLARPVGTTAPTANLPQSDLVDVKLIRGVTPVYPTIARNRRLTALVVLKVLVGKDGRVASAQFVSGPEIFKDAALQAVRQWQYSPAMLNGKPTEQETEVRLKFVP